VVDDRAHHGDETENAEVEENLRVHLALDLGTLRRSVARVLNNFGVVASEHDDTNHPGSVAENTATEEGSLEADRVNWRVLRVAVGLLENHSGSVETVHVNLGRINVETKVSLGAGLSRVEVRQAGNTTTRLEVGLAIEVLGLNKADILLFRSSTNDNVCGRCQ
jgi:hypothetical protein